eukprot:683034-Prorocentrum_lima.AAC.1
MSGKKGTLWYQNGESSELLVALKRRGELCYTTYLQFMHFRKAMGSSHIWHWPGSGGCNTI